VTIVASSTGGCRWRATVRARSPGCANRVTVIRNSWPSSSTPPGAYPDQELRFVMDNYAAHKKREILDWLAENPCIRVYFTPTSASWMSMV